MPQRGQVENFDMNEKRVEVINHSLDKRLSHPVDIMKYLHNQQFHGKTVDISDVSNFDDGLTYFSMVDPAKLITTRLEEL